MVTLYEPKESTYDKTLISFDNIPQKGNRIPLLSRQKNIYVPKPGEAAIIQYPITEPTSLIASGLLTCSACIYIYPEESNKTKINRIVLHHANASVILDENLPNSDKFNINKCNPKNIKVIIGTPNSYDDGLQETVKRLIDNGIDSNNISVYLRSTHMFGVDSFGHVGEKFNNIENHANMALTNVFIKLMNETLPEYIKRSDVEQAFLFKLFKRPAQVRGKEHVNDFINSEISLTSDRVMDYLRNGKGSMKPYSLKVTFIQHVNETLFKPNGIYLADNEILDIKNNLEKVDYCLKQFEKQFLQKANANEINFDELNDMILQKSLSQAVSVQHKHSI